MNISRKRSSEKIAVSTLLSKNLKKVGEYTLYSLECIIEFLHKNFRTHNRKAAVFLLKGRENKLRKMLFSFSGS
jgi:hypothetical protein